jgi:sigma-54 dependent transcriptional regulator of gfr operon
MVQMSRKLVEEELLKETKALKDLDEIKSITTERIAKNINLSRNTVSSYLNELLKENRVIQIKSRPTNYVSLQLFQKYFFINTKTVYSSLNDLKNDKAVSTNENVFQSLIGSHESLKDIVDRIITAETYPPIGLPVMLSGNTGVGKSYIAKVIYEYCRQKKILKENAPFLVFNCAQYFHNPELLSSILFGYKKGSFTGADSDHAGMLEDSDGGILFLDECHRLNPENQEKLFSFMDTGTFQRMGENNVSRKSNVRLIFATTENLRENFLQTFLMRIPVAISIPDLKDRSETEMQELILQTFIDESKQMNQVITVDPWIINRLLSREYNSNVGELKNLIKLICAHAYSRSEKDGETKVASDTIGHDLLKDLMKVNVSVKVFSKSIKIKPNSNLSDFVKPKMNQDDALEKILNYFSELYENYKSNKLDRFHMIELISRNSRTFMDHLVHQNNREKNDDLKYLVNIVQQLFDYLDSSFFVKIKGNAVIAVSNYIYFRQEIKLNLLFKTSTNIKNLIDIIKNNSRIEYQILKAFLDLVKTRMGLEVTYADKLLLLGYLLSLDLNILDNKCRGIILAHGYSTASSISDVINQLLNNKIFDSYDMPINVSINQVKDYLIKYLNNNDCSKGLIVLADMGSLMALPQLLKKDIKCPFLIINNVSTQLALLVGESIEKKISLKEIGKSVKESIKTEYKLAYPKITKQKMIITTCHTGIGSAEQIKKSLIKSIPKELNYKVKALDLKYLKKYGTSNSIFKEYNVQAIIGTNDPHLKGVPYIGLEKLIANDNEAILKILFPDLKDQRILNQINEKLVENISLERLLSAVTILDVHTVLRMINKIIDELEKTLGIVVKNNQKLVLYVHTSALIERMIRNEPLKDYESSMTGKRLQVCRKIKRAFREIENTYGINIGDGELNYIYDIIYNY